MAITTFTYISFPGNAREVLEFYRTVFGGDLNLITYGEQIDGGAQFPFDPPRDAIAHGTLTGPFTISGGDDLENNPRKLSLGDLGFTAQAETVEEGEQVIATLTADGGIVKMPFAKAPWGDHFGMVEDRFGVAWNVVVSEEGDK